MCCVFVYVCARMLCMCVRPSLLSYALSYAPPFISYALLLRSCSSLDLNTLDFKKQKTKISQFWLSILNFEAPENERVQTMADASQAREYRWLPEGWGQDLEVPLLSMFGWDAYRDGQTGQLWYGTASPHHPLLSVLDD